MLGEAAAAFAEEALILDADGGWHTAPSVFQRNDDGVPGLPTIAPDVAGLRLWDRLGVPARPTTDAVLAWLEALPTGASLSTAERARIRALLPRLPQRVWEGVGAWLDGAGYWRPTSSFRYASAEPDTAAALFPGVRHQTADLSMLPAVLRTQHPFSALPSLEGSLGYALREARRLGSPSEVAWLKALGRGLLSAREEPGVEAEAVARRRAAGERLLRTRWQRAATIDAHPTLDGQPAGPARAFEVLWVGDELVATDDGPRVYQALVQALTAPLSEPRLRQAVEDCAGRAPAWIEAYFEAHFALDAGGATVGERDEEDGAPEEPPAPVSHADGEAAGQEDVVTKKRKRTSATAAERGFWGAKGYAYDDVRQCFVDSDGATVQRQSGPFRWIAYDAEGALTGRFWVAGQHLDEGVEVPAEVWEVVRHDAQAALLIPAATGGLRRYEWDRLDRLVRSGTATLYPAAYRLIRAADD